MDLHRVCAAPLAHLDKTPLADTLYCFELSAQSRCSLRPEKILKPESKSCCCVRTGAIILSGSWHTHTHTHISDPKVIHTLAPSYMFRQ